MRRWRGLLAASVLGLAAALAGQAQAHHSFAVFFSAEKDVVSLKGVVKSFRFTNPHGSIELVVGEGASQQTWLVETNSPSILLRRGWSRDIIKPGDVVTIQGWPMRDGSKVMRLRNALHADGSPVGTAGAIQADKPSDK